MTNKKIGYVFPGSIADRAGISEGEELLSINGKEIHDILEYRFLSSDTALSLEILGTDGKKRTVSVRSDYDDLGIEFEEALIDKARSCTNKCIFCFIDQLPKGMRDTVYFKDDDTRLSFFQGNYVTLTNISDDELGRLIDMRVSPINISVHTTNPKLRCTMLSNRFAGNIYERMKLLCDNKIYMNCQIVLCYGINDGDELKKSLLDLAKLYPYVESVSVVPVGLTAYRDGLYTLEPYNKERSEEVISLVTSLQEQFLSELGTRLVYLSDEFYVMAGIDVPAADFYEGFPQIENGVGLIASLKEEFYDAIDRPNTGVKTKKATLVTGEAAYSAISALAKELNEKFGTDIKVIAIKNNFFGGGVTVSGLLCGADIISQLKDIDLGECLFIPDAALRDDDELFLDDTTVDDIRQELNIPVVAIANDGYEFVEKLCNTKLIF